MSSIFKRVFLIPTPLSLRRFSCQLRISWTGCKGRERERERERENSHATVQLRMPDIFAALINVFTNLFSLGIGRK